MEVLVEGPSRTDASRLRGRIRHNKNVNFAAGASRPAAPGELVDVQIGSATSTTLAGEQRLLARLAG
jgi:tRNA-2-methylthio-N6-dimethylallyladenosine synthase